MPPSVNSYCNEVDEKKSWVHFYSIFFFKMRCSLSKGSFKNYVDKMRVVKIGHLLSTFRMKHVHFEVGGQKRGKNMST